MTVAAEVDIRKQHDVIVMDEAGEMELGEKTQVAVQHP